MSEKTFKVNNGNPAARDLKDKEVFEAVATEN